MAKTTIKLKATIDPPIFKAAEAPMIEGTGDIDYTCPGCAVVLLTNLEHGQVVGGVFECPNCGCVCSMPKG